MVRFFRVNFASGSASNTMCSLASRVLFNDATLTGFPIRSGQRDPSLSGGGAMCRKGRAVFFCRAASTLVLRPTGCRSLIA
jgi:hypothetical protein